ncbi:MAG: sodium:solute symporter, partial [Alistipes sp.]|nr:sodium:solute symporter [Alistipes sp.]
FVVVTVLQSLLFGALGVSFGWSALLVVVVVWGYTFRGGVQAVIAADWVKTLLMLAALVGSIYALTTALDGSMEELWQAMCADENSRILFFDDPSSERYFWKMFVAGVVLLVAMTGLDQDMMQRNLACRSVRDVQRNILLTALCQALVIALFLGLGWLLWRYAAAQRMAISGGGDSLFSQVAVSGGLPRWVGVLFVLGFAAASFSSVGASLTALTTSFSVDVMDGKNLDEGQLERTRKFAHTVIAVLLFGLVLCFGRWADESAINLVYKVAGYTYGPILGLFLFGLWSRLRVRDGWVWLVVAVAPLLTALLQWGAERWWGYEIGFELLLYNAALVMVGLWLIRRPKATS